MEVTIFNIFILLAFVIFIVPKKSQYYFSAFIHLGLIGISGFWAINCFYNYSEVSSLPFITFFSNPLNLTIDVLSAFFILVINCTVLTGFIYAKGYLKSYSTNKSKTEFAFHHFNFIWLHISMLLVVMIRDGLAFLFVWELMSLSSFFLVIFENEKQEVIKIGLKYLMQMHIGLVFIIVAFICVYIQTNGDIGFDGLSLYFATNKPFLVFILFFIGFGIKAGFIPLHTWLPHAHPAAPSHVSGVMSGVMIKIGLYGILRVLTYIHQDLFSIGMFILVISLISGILGVTFAIVQHDVKKLLAYHSIENIGIIGIGIGLGVIGIAANIPVLAVLGFAGGILHILNHSLFKSLLFYTSGSIYLQLHTRNIEQMGGMIKKMPKTAIFFLIGSLAICGLPLFNGFISEFLIYSGIFKSLLPGNLFIDITLLFSLSGLAIIGGLAIFCFTKVFSIIFLGTPRSDSATKSTEVKGSMLISFFMIGIIIIFIGILPAFIIYPLSSVVGIFTKDSSILYQSAYNLNNISLVSGIFIGLICTLGLLRNRQQKGKIIKQGPIWGCGYTGINPAKSQYTATSYADNFLLLVDRLVNVKKRFIVFKSEEIFPRKRTFHTDSSDIFEDYLVSLPSKKILYWMEKAAVFQTGQIQHYLLYALVFLIVIFFLSILNWI
ncbi:MAG: proton-conducting transporter membrane subunit [Bacteroidota bacterium]